jgi:hypothetical protein
MTFDELNEDQRTELKQCILMERNEHRGEGTSYDELALADDLVSDESLRDLYEGTEFSEDDFTCSCHRRTVKVDFAAEEVHEDERDWEAEALKYAETVGIYEYELNGRFMEYWSFYGQGEGWMFVRYDLEQRREAFRGANIPWDGEAQIPRFLLTPDRATKYNYLVG